jgi:hypothetical protein
LLSSLSLAHFSVSPFFGLQQLKSINLQLLYVSLLLWLLLNSWLNSSGQYKFSTGND